MQLDVTIFQNGFRVLELLLELDDVLVTDLDLVDHRAAHIALSLLPDPSGLL